MTDTPAVAIIGMSGRFPGAGGIPELWANLRDGVCSISDFDPADLLAAGEDAALVHHPSYVRSRAFLADADRFEPQLFAFNRAEAAVLDPQHRLLLETAWSALEDAGISPKRPPGRTGVYVGGGTTEHMVAAQADRRLATEMNPMQLRVLTDREFLAPWLSYRLDLDGPSMTVQTACSTSLTAIHLAAQALLLGECDAALAGGVSVDSVRKHGYRYQEGGILSPDGRCRPFDENARGTVPGSGAGIVVLRRLDDALAEGDPVRAVIRGSAVTNDGSRRIGFTAPGMEMQVAAIVEAWATAGLEPASAQYIEMHGTGTDLGDRIELAAVTSARAETGTDTDTSTSTSTDTSTGMGTGTKVAAEAGTTRCAIGSVKSNLGHLDAAAGVTGLIKVVLMLENRCFVPTVNVSRPRPELVSDRATLTLPTSAQPWPDPISGGPRLAGVTSLGIGGTNVHMVLAQAPEPAPRAARPHDGETSGRANDEMGGEMRGRANNEMRGEVSGEVSGKADGPWQILPLSARTEAQVAVLAENLAQSLDSPGAPALADAAHTLQTGRGYLAARCCVVARDTGSAVAALRALASSPNPSRVSGHGPDPLMDLAEVWTGGGSVDWPPTGDARRVHLPTYPFAGERYGAYALVKPAGAAPQAAEPGTAPARGREEGESSVGADGIARLLAQSLGLTEPGEMELTFFGAGGDSLAAIHLLDRLQEEFGLEVPLEFFLDQVPLRELAASIAATRTGEGAQDNLLADLLDEVENETAG
jgi:3-oxoacyl-[acyl-carrier-protein] synthase II